MKAWHFVGDTLRDGSPVPPDGEVLRFDGKPILRVQGYHACRRLIDALSYALGSTICRVQLGGTIVQKGDKAVATERTILWRIDGYEILQRYARRCALDVVHLWDAPDVVVRYLDTGDDSIRAVARAAARAATRAAYCDAARAAARAAYCAAARAAYWATARATAWDAARAAAWATAGDATRDAARAATWDATWDAVRDRQNRRLTSMVLAEKRR